MLWWLGSLTSGAALLLLSRWALGVSRPAEDVVTARRLLERPLAQLRDAWSIFWRAYGPITADVRSAWETLRARYQRGSFGTEGT